MLPFGEDFVPLDTWPQACDLLTDDEIRSVLPQTEQVLREPEDQEFEPTTIGPPGAGPIVTAPGANCVYEVELPGAGLALEDASGPASVELRIYAVGSPDIVQLNFDRSDDPFEVSGGECSAGTVYGLSCHSESVAFTVRFVVSHSGVDSEDRNTVEAAFAGRVLVKLPATTPGPPPSP